MLEHEAVEECARQIAYAIGRRDRAALMELLSTDFVHRTPGGDSVGLAPFLDTIDRLPDGILSVTLHRLVIDVAGDAALATGLQRARVVVDGRLVDDTRAFVDWFTKDGDAWRLRVAAELRGSTASEK